VLIATTCKPFQGNDAIRQRNAILSWKRLDSNPRIVVFGKEAEEFCALHGIENYPVKRKFGLPLVSDIFGQAQEIADGDIVCYANSDIIMDSTLPNVALNVREMQDRFLIVGQRIDLDIDEKIDFDGNWEQYLNQRLHESGRIHPPYGIDYFVWHGDVYPEIPDFLIGVVWFDNWLVWRAIYDGVPVFNASKVINVVHQEHGGTKQPRDGKKADYNHNLARNNGCYLVIGVHHAIYNLGLKQ